MLSKKLLISLLILTCFLTITSVSAVDNTTQTSTDDSSVLTDSSTANTDTSSLGNFMNMNNANTNSSTTSTFSMDNMPGMNMSGMNMSNMNMSNMNMSDMTNMMNMSGMNMSGMNMSNMNMSDMSNMMNMSGMNMSDMNMSGIPGMNITPTDNTNTTNDTTPETNKDNTQGQSDIQQASHTSKHKVNKQTPTKTSYSPQKVGQTYTIKKASDNTVVYQGNALTLEAINKIFNQDIVNGHLVVYMDGKVVFNDTVTDDLSTTILKIVEQYLGKHNIKIEFTDGDNNTNTYQEDIIIE